MIKGNKKLFTTDFEIHASIKMLYPYIQTASGLSEWFADNVKISPEKVFTFVWDSEEHKAIMNLNIFLNQKKMRKILPILSCVWKSMNLHKLLS